MASFAPLLQTSIDAVRERGAIQRELPPDIAHQQVRDTVMRTESWQLERLGEFRAVSIEGSKVHIISMFLWPEPAWDAPTYAMEFVVFGPKPIVAVIDAVGLGSPVSRAAGQTILENRAKDFARGANPPAWYEDCRSGHDVFVRPANLATVKQLEGLHRDAFHAAIATLIDSPPLADPGPHQAALRSYKRHHRENTPGLSFLQKSFGAAWTQRYLEEWVFA